MYSKGLLERGLHISPTEDYTDDDHFSLSNVLTEN